MLRRAQLVIGIGIIVFGSILLIGNVLQVNIWAYVWPLLVITLGVWIILRPRVSGRAATAVRLLGEIRRIGAWQVRDQEIWTLISDVDLNFTSAAITEGETVIRVLGFIGDVDLTVPDEVGLRVISTGFVTSAKVFGYSQDYLLTGYETETPAFAEADRRVRVELVHFVTDLTIRAAGDAS